MHAYIMVLMHTYANGKKYMQHTLYACGNCKEILMFSEEIAFLCDFFTYIHIICYYLCMLTPLIGCAARGTSNIHKYNTIYLAPFEVSNQNLVKYRLSPWLIGRH